MLKKAEELYAKAPRPHNPAPLTIREDQISDYSPPPESPVFNQARRNRGLTGILYYSQQKALLDKLNAKLGKDEFVSKYTFTQRPDGSYTSYSVWTRTVPTLLPKTDL